MSTASDPWGRVADDGTVYVRTAEGEREIGSWQAGSPDEALAFFKRKFDSLETEVSLLEQRMSSTDLSAGQAKSTIARLTAQIAAEATHWKASGERMRLLLEEWKAAPRGDRAAEAALWKRLSAARNGFAKRRKAYFATLEEEREGIRARKEELVSKAEELSASTDWSATATAYRELMRSWKQAGRADRTAEDDLWNRFKAAQDAFFKARSEVLDAKDRELREHVVVKEQLLAEAEKLLPVTDARTARATLRGVLERWERAGAVPRDSQDRLEGGLRKIEESLRKAEDSPRRSWLAEAERTLAELAR